ncbi:hypothetical protein [Streptomyces natalensis]|uniref:hypothetical protein n=1 Tax=Streptomyces natalensis TaxID=68242 RepID=UPI000AB2F7D2|nr:hypothetical protein [Streptomyces natalensis]
MTFKTWKEQGMSRPLGARKPKGDMKKTAAVSNDDRATTKQRAEKAELLNRMRDRINGAPAHG